MSFAAGLIFAVFAQFVLVIALLLVLGRQRVPLVQEGKVKLADIALDSNNWPEESRKASNALNNQFQLPVLMYVAVGLAIYLGAGIIDVLFAWAFVISRYVHAGIHITTNRVTRRFVAYVVGLALLACWWIYLFGHFVLSGLGA